MIIKKVAPTKEYEPVTIEITLDTEVEFDTLLTLSGTDVSIPEAVSRGGMKKPKYSRSCLQDMLSTLNNVLRS